MREKILRTGLKDTELGKQGRKNNKVTLVTSSY